MSVRDMFEDRAESRYAPTMGFSFRVVDETPQEIAFHGYRDHHILDARLSVHYRANSAQLGEAKEAAFRRMADCLYRDQITLTNLLHASVLAGDQEECLKLVVALRESMQW